jgi:hypothetical protein
MLSCGMLSRGVFLALRGAAVVMSLGVAGCHQTPGTLPVDSKIHEFKAPDLDDDDDSDATDSGASAGSDAGSGAGSGSAKKE